MVAVMDTLPGVCPRCGDDLEMSTEDWFAGACGQCPCGLLIAYADEESILKAADAVNGDLRRQHQGG